MTNVKLLITPQPSTEKPSQRFVFIGTIDVDAIPVLEPLYALPANCAIELDFARLERVNSMGLAQLLKLFEHWQKQSSTIKIFNVNRMITVLFKMTGLTRFLSNAPVTANPVAAASSASARPAERPPAMAATPSLAPAGATLSRPVPTPHVSNPSPSILQQAALHIQPEPSTEALRQQFDFIGMIDVNAVPTLSKLYLLPASCHVTLDFAQLQRVNSMGLAQLLKLFEHWQHQRITIRIVNINRMVEVLFKMTGLTRFLTNEDGPAPTSTPPAQPAPTQTGAAPPAPKTTKLNLWISAQSSQQMNGWYFFNTYLQRQLGVEIHPEIMHGSVNEQTPKSPEQMDIVFSKPFEATRLLIRHRFHAVMRPLDQTDEVTLLVRADDARQQLVDFKGGKVITAAPDNFVYLLGRFLLEQNEEALQEMDYVFSGHDIKALQMLLKGQADILFMLSETYRGLSSLSKRMLREIDQSETAFAFHMFSVSPACAHLADKLGDVLLNMGMDSQGRQVLADLGITGWVKPTQDELNMLTMLFNRYAS